MINCSKKSVVINLLWYRIKCVFCNKFMVFSFMHIEVVVVWLMTPCGYVVWQ